MLRLRLAILTMVLAGCAPTARPRAASQPAAAPVARMQSTADCMPYEVAGADPERVDVEPGSGWWCTPFLCDRDERACRAVERGGHGPCEHVACANCFGMPVNGGVFPSCLPSRDRCEQAARAVAQGNAAHVVACAVYR